MLQLLDADDVRVQDVVLLCDIIDQFPALLVDYQHLPIVRTYGADTVEDNAPLQIYDRGTHRDMSEAVEETVCHRIRRGVGLRPARGFG